MFLSEYDGRWADDFEAIRRELAAGLKGGAAIHHVGSTAVPGMLAKPIIDIDVELAADRPFAAAERELAALGYTHCGDQGIPGREAFKRGGAVRHAVLDSISHHLYVCAAGGAELERHLLFRDYLRRHDAARDAYIAIKKAILAAVGAENRAGYVEMKETVYRPFFELTIDAARREAGNGFPAAAAERVSDWSV
jgi:GrpB-like predicted nucleotidyltransferase (UPF0157 family)